MIAKRSKVHISYLYTQIRYKSLTVSFKNGKGEVLTSQYQKELFTLNMFSKDKQSKTNQERWDKRRKSFTQIIQP